MWRQPDQTPSIALLHSPSYHLPPQWTQFMELSLQITLTEEGIGAKLMTQNLQCGMLGKGCRSHGADKRASKRPPGAGLVSCLIYDAHSYFSRHFSCLYETAFAQCCDGVYCNGLAYHLPSFFFSRPGPTRAINKQQATTATNRRLSLAYRCVSIFLGPWYGGR